MHIIFYKLLSCRFLTGTQTVDTFNYPSCLISVPAHQAPFFIFFLSVTLKIIAVQLFCWCILFYIVKMSGLSHWHNFLVLMLLFGYTTAYSPCCCESHNSHPFISFHFLLHKTCNSDKNLYQLFVDLISYLTGSKVLV